MTATAPTLWDLAGADIKQAFLDSKISGWYEDAVFDSWAKYEGTLDGVVRDIKESSTRELVVFIPASIFKGDISPSNLMSDLSKSYSLGICHLSVPLRVGGVDYPSSWLIVGAESLPTAVAVLEMAKLGNATMVRPTTTKSEAREMMDPKGGVVDVAQDVVVYVCNQLQLLTLLEQVDVPAVTKMLSSLCTLFPKARPDMQKFFSLKPFEVAMDEYGMTLKDPTAMTPAALVAEYRSATIFWALLNGYSDKATFAAQIYKRMTAGLASISGDPIQESIYEGTVRTFDVLPGSAGGHGDRGLGIILARDTTCKYDPTVTDANLIESNTQSNTWKLTKWSEAVLGQMRIVFEHKHQATLNFTQVFVVAADLTDWTYPPFIAAEKIKFEAAMETIKGRRYGCLIEKQADHLQVKNFPALAVLGLEYHKKSLDDAEKKEFAKYAIAGIREHIKSAHERATLDLMITVLPDPNISMIGQLAQTTSARFIEMLVSHSTTNIRDALFMALSHLTTPGLWFDEELKRRQDKELKDAEGRLLKLLGDLRDNTIKQLQAMYMGARTDEDRRKISDLIRRCNEAYDTKTAVYTAPETLFDPPSHPTFKAAIDAIIAVYKDAKTTLENILKEAFSG